MIEIIGWIAAVFGISGSLLLALNNTKYSKFGWIGFLIGSVLWTSYAVVNGIWSMAVSSSVFVVVESIGLYRYFNDRKIKKAVDKVSEKTII